MDPTGKTLLFSFHFSDTSLKQAAAARSLSTSHGSSAHRVRLVVVVVVAAAAEGDVLCVSRENGLSQRVRHHLQRVCCHHVRWRISCDTEDLESLSMSSRASLTPMFQCL